MTRPGCRGPSRAAFTAAGLAATIFLSPAFSGFGQAPIVLAAPELLPTGDLRIGVSGAPNDFVSLQYSADIGGAWNLLASFHLDASGTGEYIDSAASPQRVYRASMDGGGGNVYSVNIIGFIRVPVPAAGAFIGNPFLTTNGNAIASVLPNAPNGIVVMKIGASGYQANNFLNGWWDPSMPLRPGEGFFVKNAPAGGATLTFLGEVVQANCSRLPAGLSLASSIVPRSGPLQSQLQFPATDGDEVFIFNSSSGAYDVYDFFFDAWFPGEPFIAVGQAFWCSKSTAADWVQAGGGGGCGFGPTVLASSVAQVNFFTYSSTPGFGRVLGSDGVTPLGTNFLAQLYAGTNAAEASLVRSGTAVRFLPGTVAGYVRGGVVDLNNASPGQTVYLQVRAWDSAFGTNYEAAVGGSRGKSGE